MPPGLQAERTRLSWRRTTLSGALIVLIAASRTITAGLRPLSVVAVCLMALVWLASLVVAHRRISELTDLPAETARSDREPAHLALLVTALAALGVLAVLGSVLGSHP